MVNIKLPASVEFILRRLKNAGFEAYIVGGCVRDSLMGIEPHDWDICTSARPEETIRVFDDFKIVPTGLKHGTVSVMVANVLYEITTFRSDGEYSDNRHPDSVSFVKDLKTDLSRRDFTMNAMAYCYDTGLVDLYGGAEDVEKKLVRCVGDPIDRFSEDALRILRTVRFAIRFGFEIEEKTLCAMARLQTNVHSISAERIRDELIKILCAIDFNNVNQAYYRFFLAIIYSYCDYDNWDVDFSTIPRQFLHEDNDLLSILYTLFDAECTKKLRFSNEITKYVRDVRSYSDFIYSELNAFIHNERDLQYYARTLLGSSNIDVLKDAIKRIKYTYDINEEFNMLLYMLHLQLLVCDMRSDPVHVSDLDINGYDLMELGFNGKEIGFTMDRLLDMVIYDKVENKKEDLLREAKRMKEEC